MELFPAADWPAHLKFFRLVRSDKDDEESFLSNALECFQLLLLVVVGFYLAKTLLSIRKFRTESTVALLLHTVYIQMEEPKQEHQTAANRGTHFSRTTFKIIGTA